MFKPKAETLSTSSEIENKPQKKRFIPEDLVETIIKSGGDIALRRYYKFMREKTPEFLKEMEKFQKTLESFGRLGYKSINDWREGPLKTIFEESGKNSYKLSEGTQFIVEKNEETAENTFYLLPDFRFTDGSASYTVYGKDRKLAYRINSREEKPEAIKEEEFERIVNNQDNMAVDYNDMLSHLEKE